MSQGIRHAPFTTFFNDISLYIRHCCLTSAEPLILSAVLIVKYSSSSLKALRSTSLKLNLSLTFYSLSCVNMSKISWTHSSEGRFRNRTEITTVSPNLYLNKQFRVQEALGSTEPNFLISFCSDWLIINYQFNIAVSPERRCSSRTFRYGYLVTT